VDVLTTITCGFNANGSPTSAALAGVMAQYNYLPLLESVIANNVGGTMERARGLVPTVPYSLNLPSATDTSFLLPPGSNAGGSSSRYPQLATYP